MFPIKAIKIGLPVATATSAAIATTSLVSFSKKDEFQKEEDLDKALNDFKLPNDKYQDEKMFYSKDGTGKNQKVLDQETAERLAKILKKDGNLDNVGTPKTGIQIPENFDHKATTDQDQKQTSDVKSEQVNRALNLQATLPNGPAESNDDVNPKSRELEDKPLDSPTLSSQDEDRSGDKTNSSPLEESGGKEPSLRVIEPGTEKGEGEPKDPLTFASNSDQGDGGSNLENSNSVGDDSTSGESPELNKGQPSPPLSVQTQQPEVIESVGGETNQREAKAPSGSLGDGAGSNSLSGGNEVMDGTDSNGRKENLTEADIKRWSDVEAEISSVVGELQSLINI